MDNVVGVIRAEIKIRVNLTAGTPDILRDCLAEFHPLSLPHSVMVCNKWTGRDSCGYVQIYR